MHHQQALHPFIGCKTVIEKNQFVDMGTISYMEGDVIEIEILRTERFALGENVKLVAYTPFGLVHFETSLIAKDNRSVMFIVPHEVQVPYLKKRAYPRIDLFQPATIRLPGNPPHPVDIVVHNISLGGIGFTIRGAVRLVEKLQVFVDLHFDNRKEYRVEIVHQKRSEDTLYYGAKFIDLSVPELNSLKAFILTQQVKIRSKQKNMIVNGGRS
jgi:c-di-GMP-binding flagellar brake protein YcgR